MPVSDKQLQANRKNAQNATGPKTDEGKQIVASNATKHGLYSKDIIINSPGLKENREDYEKLVVALFNEFQPIGEFQEQLVFKIANCIWRSRRAIKAETAQLNEQLEKTSKYSTDDLTNSLNLRSIPNNYFALLIQRYEMRLDRQLTRAYNMLIHNQKMNAKLNDLSETGNNPKK